MKNLTKRKKLLNEALDLIEEFESIIIYIRKSEKRDFKISIDYRELSYVEGEMEVAYSHYLDNISEIYSREIDGCERRIENLDYEVYEMKKNVTNEEKGDEIRIAKLINEIDEIFERCKEIYNRLKQIELEATYVMG